MTICSDLPPPSPPTYVTPIVIGIAACVVCKIIENRESKKINEALPRLNEQIQHIKSVEHHGIFRKPQQPVVMQDDKTAFLDSTPARLAKMDDALIPLMKIRKS